MQRPALALVIAIAAGPAAWRAGAPAPSPAPPARSAPLEPLGPPPPGAPTGDAAGFLDPTWQAWRDAGRTALFRDELVAWLGDGARYPRAAPCGVAAFSATLARPAPLVLDRGLAYSGAGPLPLFGTRTPPGTPPGLEFALAPLEPSTPAR